MRLPKAVPPTFLEEKPTDTGKFIRELFGLFLLFWALLLFLALFSFDAQDPSVNVVKSAAEVHNKAGLFGAYAAGFLNDFFGACSLLWPFIFAAMGTAYISAAFSFQWGRWCGFFLLTLCLLTVCAASDCRIGDLSGGGMLGNNLYYNSRRYLSPFGAFILWLFVFMAASQLICNFSWLNIFSALRAKLETYIKTRKNEGKIKEQEKPEIIEPLPPDASGKKSKNPSPGAVLDSISNKNPLPALLAKIPAFLKAHCQTIASAIKARREEDQARAPMPEIRLNEPGRTEADDDDLFAASENLSLGEKKRSDEKREEEKANLPDSGNTDEPGKNSPGSAFTIESAEPAPEIPQLENSPEMAAPEDAEVEAPREKRSIMDRLIDHIKKGGEEKPPAPGPSMKKDREEPKELIPLPTADLLSLPSQAPLLSREEMEARGQALMACFNDFDIQGKLVRITPGPVVTMYEVRPAPGVRVSKIANLSDDLSLALKAVAVRIQAPIPGSDTVGIEIPNDRRETVNFRELEESEAFQKGCGPLTMILGKDIAGRPYMADLTRMPHLLVAGATGAGKSVCLNSILASFLYKAQPEDLKLLLVDPKRIEMAVYADLPHLVHPVVTEMSDAKNALDWAVHEMDMRYKAIARLGVRNVTAYNQKFAAYKNDLPPDFADLAPLPYLVIVIDELADLMMTAAREIEVSIVRLAQLARAAGIHMILATQRPSVDVVTGLIKANFPCRISFQVTSKHDSRTILDQVGAEHLLGRGDMLFKPSGGRLQRLHGPFLSDEEVQAIVSHWKKYRKPSYEVDFSQWSGDSASPAIGGDSTSDPLYGEARDFVLAQGRASISLLQRHFKIGFNRAARLMEQFERDGLIGPADGSKPRNVIR